MRRGRYLLLGVLLGLPGCLPPSGGGSGSGSDNGDSGGPPPPGDAPRPGDMGVAPPRAVDMSIVPQPPIPADASTLDPPDFGRPFVDASPPVLDQGFELDAAVGCDDRLPEGAFIPGEFEPATRITQLSIPPSIDVAAAIGCDVTGDNAGTALAGFLSLLGLPNNNLRESAEVVDVIELQGWRPGRSLGDAPGDFVWYQATPQGDFAERPTFLYEGFYDYECPEISGEFLNVFELLPATPRNPFRLMMVLAKLSLAVTPAQSGFRSAGTLTGYIEVGYLIDLIGQIQRTCSDDSPPEFCEEFDFLLGEDPESFVFSTLLPVLGGADALIAPNGTVSDLCDNDCNAISVCAEVGGIPVTLIMP